MLAVGAVWPLLPVHPPSTCPLLTLTGIPCPLCGMTRAVVAAEHGHWLASLRFNPLGIPLVVGVIALLVARKAQPRLRLPVWVLPAMLGVVWLWNIGFNPTFR